MRMLILIALVAVATAQKVQYDNYKVFRVTPNTEEQFQLISNLEDVSDGVSAHILRLIPVKIPSNV